MHIVGQKFRISVSTKTFLTSVIFIFIIIFILEQETLYNSFEYIKLKLIFFSISVHIIDIGLRLRKPIYYIPVEYHSSYDFNLLTAYHLWPKIIPINLE